ncbi:MAG: zeta toxin family protein [Pseudomonadota bacterium]
MESNRLPSAYLQTAKRFFDPLVERLERERQQQTGPLFVALNGSQGSGKSTLAEYLAQSLIHERKLSTVVLSLDDFYLTRVERQELAQSVHPLLRTRGVPGTHDLTLLARTLDSMSAEGSMKVPRFDKSQDDRVPEERWDSYEVPSDIVILEGWCLGATGDDRAALERPLNDLERDEDSDGRWRTYTDAALKNAYLPLYKRFDIWLMLRAPSFDEVLRWRTEQEEKLRASVGEGGAGLMNDAALRRFVAHYERHTRQCLRDLPQRVDVLLNLDEHRQILSCRGLP